MKPHVGANTCCGPHAYDRSDQAFTFEVSLSTILLRSAAAVLSLLAMLVAELLATTASESSAAAVLLRINPATIHVAVVSRAMTQQRR